MKPVSSSRKFPLFVRVLLSAGLVLSFSVLLQAQSSVDSISNTEAAQSRVARARALIAAHQLDIAARELESLRAGTQDYAVRTVSSVMLMSVYLEEGNYTRAEALLEETFQTRSSKNGESLRTYFAVAGQAVNGARTHLARYRNFAVNTSDSDLPVEATNDLDRLRSLLERMIAQAKVVAANRRGYDSLSLLEDVLGIRVSLAKDEEDQVKWQAEYAQAREVLASSQTEVASLGGGPILPKTRPATVRPVAAKINDRVGVPSNKPLSDSRLSSNEKSQSAGAVPVKDDTGPAAVDTTSGEAANEPNVINTGALNSKATKKVLPRYPALAKQKGDVGLVRVYVVINEKGKVAGVFRSEGPMLLRQAAEEAARKWFFEAPPSADRPTRWIGYIDFNFTL